MDLQAALVWHTILAGWLEQIFTNLFNISILSLNAQNKNPYCFCWITTVVILTTIPSLLQKKTGLSCWLFHPHCSHALQPLDVSVFGPYKRTFAKSQNEWLQSHPGGRISIKEIAKLSASAFSSAFTRQNIISGFSATGIFPFNRTAIPDARYAPSFVTDRPGKDRYFRKCSLIK